MPGCPDPAHLMSLWNFVRPKSLRSVNDGSQKLGSIYITPSNLWRCLNGILDAGSFFIPVSSFHSLFWMFWGSLPYWEDFNSRDCANTNPSRAIRFDWFWLADRPHWPPRIFKHQLHGIAAWGCLPAWQWCTCPRLGVIEIHEVSPNSKNSTSCDDL